MSPRSLAGALVAALVLAAPAAAAPKAPLKCNGSAALCAKTFDQVVLPGTHNSMSAASLGWKYPNQQVGIPAQLKLGIRGLLVDTYLVGPKVFLCHLTCDNGRTPLASVLGQMAAFLKSHPGEVVMVVNEDHTPAADFVKAVNASPLKRYLYRGATGPWPTLRQMVRSNQRVVMTAERDVTGATPWYHSAYTGILQETPYTWDQETLLTDPAQQPASCVANRGGTTGSLFLMNHWAPSFPADAAIAARVNARDVLVSRARTCAQVRGKLPTLIAVDMVGSGDVVGAAAELNGTR